MGMARVWGLGSAGAQGPRASPYAVVPMLLGRVASGLMRRCMMSLAMHMERTAMERALRGLDQVTAMITV